MQSYMVYFVRKEQMPVSKAAVRSKSKRTKQLPVSDDFRLGFFVLNEVSQDIH